MVGYSWARLDAAILVLEGQVEVFCLGPQTMVGLTRTGSLSKIACPRPNHNGRLPDM